MHEVVSHYRQDFEVYMTKLIFWGRKWNAWGESLYVSPDLGLLALGGLWDQEQETVEKVPVGIKDIFQDSYALESKVIGESCKTKSTLLL